MADSGSDSEDDVEQVRRRSTDAAGGHRCRMMWPIGPIFDAYRPIGSYIYIGN